jgi:hypothetical protein
MSIIVYSQNSTIGELLFIVSKYLRRKIVFNLEIHRLVMHDGCERQCPLDIDLRVKKILTRTSEEIGHVYSECLRPGVA